MNNKKISKKSKIEAAIIAIVFLGTAFAIPMSIAETPNTNDLFKTPYVSSSIEDQKAWLDR